MEQRDLKERVRQRERKKFKYALFSLHNAGALALAAASVSLMAIATPEIFEEMGGGQLAVLVLALAWLTVALVFFYFFRRRIRGGGGFPSRGEVRLALGEVFDPVNMVLILGNVLVFILVQTLFFWYVASSNTIDSAKELSDFAVTLTLASGDSTDCDLDRAAIAAASKQAEKDRAARDRRNLSTTIKYIGSFVLLLLLLIALNLRRAHLQQRRFTRIEAVLFIATIIAFVTEVCFYFLVIRGVTYIGEFEAMSELRRPFSTSDWTAIGRPYVERGACKAAA